MNIQDQLDKSINEAHDAKEQVTEVCNKFDKEKERWEFKKQNLTTEIEDLKEKIADYEVLINFKTSCRTSDPVFSLCTSAYFPLLKTKVLNYAF